MPQAHLNHLDGILCILCFILSNFSVFKRRALRILLGPYVAMTEGFGCLRAGTETTCDEMCWTKSIASSVDRP